MPLGMEVGLGPADFLLDVDPAPPRQKKGQSTPKFSAHVYCGQKAVCIKMPLGMEVGLSPGHIVLDGDLATPTPPEKGGTAPSQFSAHIYCGQTAVCIRIPLGVEVGLSPGDIVLDGDPAPPPLKGHSSNFRPMSVEAKWLNGLRCHLVWM